MPPPAKKPASGLGKILDLSRGIFGNALTAGPKQEGAPTAGAQKAAAVVSPAPGERDWSKIDLSKGPIHVNEGLYEHTTGNFELQVRAGLHESLGTMLDATKREKIAKAVADVRHNGLTSGKVQDQIHKLVQNGDLDKFEAKRVLRHFGATHHSSFF